MNPTYEMYDDPYKMLILLASLTAEHLGITLDFERVPAYANETFELEHERFLYKKDHVKIRWHQFLGRDIQSSRDLSRGEYNKMFVDCMASLYGISQPGSPA